MLGRTKITLSRDPARTETLVAPRISGFRFALAPFWTDFRGPV
jgi:hypothetical protein